MPARAEHKSKLRSKQSVPMLQACILQPAALILIHFSNSVLNRPANMRSSKQSQKIGFAGYPYTMYVGTWLGGGT